ncbi:MAG: sulfide/dihydroorotate dehydrogenase-like FAD/NAD-binding protein [Acidobacteria bacterium]|nr:sulfide/dihydroorotate dehydrogenase-like FAD/NAD-binding protein [Acidobacteriota bacterium]
MYQIVKREQFSDVTFLWDVHAPDVANAAKPGHFVMLRLREGGERIPLTVADYDREWGTVTVVVQALGKTTKEMMRDFKEGDSFADFVGPLGLESHIGNVGHVVVVGGGLGVAPIFPQLRAFKEAGCRTTGIIGFRTKELVFWEERFRQYCDDLIVCTDDGSYGKPGFVTSALKEVLEKEKPDMVVAIGPMPMMRASCDVTRPFGVKTMVSLNAIMVDGTGMCGSCRVTVDGHTKFACVDGPDFDGHQVDFPELLNRQERFKSEEKEANDDFQKICTIEEQLFELKKRNYKKLKELPEHAVKMPERDAKERSRNFEEVNLGYTMSDAMVEAERCIQCLKPTCIAGCPVAIDIPRFIRMEPVAIGRLERFVGDHAPLPDVHPPENAGQLGRVAIVGSGPAGLAAAGDLARNGADVTVYEALHVVGGVLRYGIPSFRLPRTTIDREVSALAKLGVKFETNKVIGKTFTVQQLMSEMKYDAVFIGTGAGFPSFLGIPGEQARQVYSANEFLTRVNLMGGDHFPFEDTPVTLGKRVVVLGAGNTAMDCLRVSRRLGAEEVHCVYRRTESEAPCRIEELRHAKEEGIHFNWLMSPTEIKTDEKGNVTALVVQKMELGEPDKSGRRRPVPIEGAFETFECETVIYALGTRANPVISRSTPDLSVRGEGYINADGKTQATSLPGVFAGGDIVTGGATVILALGAGRRAARAMEKYLKTREWPVVLDDEVAPVEAAASSVEAACPKCRRPFEAGDDDEHICCGGDLLIWTCDSCQKVSEGFAFPYGLCPHCGGHLSRGHESLIGSEATVEAVRQALEIELGGLSFYARGAKEVEAKDPELADLFRDLSEMEKEHMITLARRYHIDLPDEPLNMNLTPAQVAVFAGETLAEYSGAELLRLAVHLEKRARAFFLDAGRQFPVGSREWKLYRELEAEEREHTDLLATVLKRMVEEKPVMV